MGWWLAIERLAAVKLVQFPEKVRVGGLAATAAVVPARLAKVPSVRLQIAVALFALVRKVGLVLVLDAVAVAQVVPRPLPVLVLRVVLRPMVVDLDANATRTRAQRPAR